MASASGSVEMVNSKGKPGVQAVKTGKGTEKRYKCRFCNKEFISSYLKVHERIHTGQKPFSCNFCSKNFARASNLERHKRIHTGEMPYKCDKCTKCFKCSSDLVVHKRLHSGEKPFGCRFCGRYFRAASNRIAHERCHTGERPHQCDSCSKSFARSDSLTKHKRIHSNLHSKGFTAIFENCSIEFENDQPTQPLSEILAYIKQEEGIGDTEHCLLSEKYSDCTSADRNSGLASVNIKLENPAEES